MKRKLLNGFLALAVTVAGAGVFSSCKDTNEDMITQAESNLRAELEQKRKELKDAIDALEDAQKDALEKCKTNCENQIKELSDKLDQAKADLQDAINKKADQTTVDALTDRVKTLEDQMTDALLRLATVEGDLATAQSTIGEHTTAITEIMNILEGLGYGGTSGVGGITVTNPETGEELQLTLQEVVDYFNGIIYEITLNIDALKDDMADEVEALQDQIDALRDEVADGYVTKEDFEAYQLEVTSLISSLYSSISLNEQRITALENDLDALKPDIQKGVDAYDWAERNQARIEALEANSATKEELREAIESLKEELTGTIDNLTATFTSQINDIFTALNGKASQADLDAAVLRIAANETAISKLSQKYTELEQKLNSVAADVLALLGKTDRINDRLNKLITGVLVQATYNPVFGSFALPVGVQSNVLMSYAGDCSTKVTFPNNSSAAEYNNEMWINSADMAVLREGANFKQLSFEPGEILIEEREGNAGKVYVTINPNTVDFTGVTLTLNNSRDEESGIKLSSIKKSDELLTFGYGRADNGFYEASANLAADKVNDVKINLEPSLKSAVKETLQNLRDRKFSAGSLVDLGQAIYKQFYNILPAYAMKAAWTAPDINGIDVNHAVYSQYNLAATAFKPLSFKFLYDTKLPNIPTISPINGERFDLSKFKEKLNFKFDDIEIEGVTIDDFNISINLDALNIDFNFDLSGIEITKTENVVIDTNVEVNVDVPTVTKVYDEFGKLVDVEIGSETKHITAPVNVSQPVTITIDGNDLEPLADAINDAVQSAIQDALKNQLPGIINDQLNSAIKSQVQNVVDKMIGEMNTQINDMLNKVAADLNDQIGNIIDDIQNEIDGYVGKVNDYIDRANSVIERLNGYINNFNHYLQPMMVYKGVDNAYHQLSTTKTMPTPLNLAGGNAITFLPTTYTGEIAVPVFKKFIGVTNVWKADNEAVSAQGGDATCKELAKNANDAYLMGAPILGITHRVPFTANKSGYTYEIVYSALDYQGVTSTRKYYVTVK